MRLKHILLILILGLYCSLCEASDNKILKFIEFHKTTLTEVEQYLNSNKCNYTTTEIEKGYRKFRTLDVSSCFNLPMEVHSLIDLIYHNSIKDFIVSEVTIVYLNMNNTFNQYQTSLKKKYGEPINKFNRESNIWRINNLTINHINSNTYGVLFYTGIADASIGDFDFNLLTDNKLLGFIEINKTTPREVKNKLDDLNCSYNEFEDTYGGIKSKVISFSKCIFLPNLRYTIIRFVNYNFIKSYTVDEVVFSFKYDRDTYNLYIDKLKNKYFNKITRNENAVKFNENEFKIYLTDEGSLIFRGHKLDKLKKDIVSKSVKERDSLDSL
ncbi:hypothetical protein [Anaerobiospirillum thomasii]|uniref:Uncharacterized protein n=1 Tax=Anaerobiospirillum thomasii TaxID=179995 RepID=A0A2X0VC05_9GAMM|nr:hypothetical protein [Anaerobiospirillum thomasii]SPT70385.1 Uncharacterised protein [Anaerobiospirillum thomasii]